MFDLLIYYYCYLDSVPFLMCVFLKQDIFMSKFYSLRLLDSVVMYFLPIKIYSRVQALLWDSSLAGIIPRYAHSGSFYV